MNNKPKRLIAISDLHGCHTVFLQLLEQVNYDPASDQLILLGDYTDRGLESKALLEEIYDLKQKHEIITVLGNHDQMILDCFASENPDHWAYWLFCGGAKMLESYHSVNWVHYLQDPLRELLPIRDYIQENYAHHIELLKNCVLSYETDKHFFVHAGLHPILGRDTSKYDMLWIREPFLANPNPIDKTIIFGHTPTHRYHQSNCTDIWTGERRICIDGGSAYGKMMHALVISDNETRYEVVSVPHDYTYVRSVYRDQTIHNPWKHWITR